jgi:predicted secreted Zn-dependent protease
MVSIKACFYPKDSWKGNYIDDALLAHEQKHFDIVELYARKLRKQLMEIKVQDQEDAQQKLDSLHKIIDAEMDAYQDKYDEESDYSMAHDKQVAWIKRIDAVMDSLANYQNTEIRLKPAF